MENDYSNGKAIPFITYDSLDQRFVFNPECEKILNEIQGDFSVISIVGMYRSGKSYLLNKMLLNYSKGFLVGKTVNACTKGIWIWSKPLLGYNSEGKTIPVLLLDTEGFGSHDSDFSHDSKIFTLAVLLSSLFMYNSIGVIDEAVLDSLGFICNLGKLIGSKTLSFHNHQNVNEANYNTNISTEHDSLNTISGDIFPSLLWILRDFTLQLLDDDGTNLTATDYMEKVLRFIPKSKAESEKNLTSHDTTVTNKETVRSTIKKYFKYRECMIMVRPTNSENDLQNLDELSDENIRPEFLAQVLSLRKKLFYNCRAKTFNGVKLNSESYLIIVKEYIEILNSGKLPTIDSIWNNICRYETEKALDEAENIYEEFLRDNLNKKCLDESEFEKIHEKAKELSLGIFRRKSMGDISNIMKKTLKKKIDDKLQIFSKLNDEEIKNEIFNFLKINFNKIEIKLKKGEINSLDDLNNEIISVENKCIETYPNTRIRSEMILDFKYRVMFFASNYIISKLLDEKKYLCEKIDNDINSYSENKEKINNELNNKIEENKKQQMELNYIKEELVLAKEKWHIYENDKAQLINSYEEKFKALKDENTKNMYDLNEKFVNKEKQFLESEKKGYEAREKYEKEKAELLVKIEFLTKNINEISSKEKEKSIEAEMQYKEQILINGTTIMKFEKMIKELNSNIDCLNEKIGDLENKLFEKENFIEMEKNKSEELFTKLFVEKSELLEKLKNMKFKLEMIENKNNEEVKLKENEILKLKNLLTVKDQENSEQIKIIEENLKSNLLKTEKELSMQMQNNHFLEFKCQELTNQISELKINYEKAISAFEQKLLSHSESNITKDEDLKNYLILEKKQLEENFELEKGLLNREIESLKDKLNKKDENHIKIIEEMEKVNKEYKENYDRIRTELITLQNSKYKLEEEKSQTQEEYNLNYKKFMEDFEKKMEEKEALYRKDIDIVSKSCEDTISNYKAMFENEKARIEEKMKEEKTKFDKRMKYAQEEYESKLNEIIREMKSEIENLKDENEELDGNYKNYMIEAENEIKNLNQKLLSMEANLKENKEYLANFQNQYNANIDKKTESFNLERKELLKKIEILSADINTKDQELTALKFKQEQLEKQIHEYNLVFQKEKDSNEEMKNDLQFKYEAILKKNKDITDEYSIKKLEYIRESNLLKQQIEFLNKKLDELTKSNEDNIQYIQNIKLSYRKEVEADFANRIEELKKDREEIYNKLNNKKKEHRDLEQAFLKQTCIFDKEKQTLNEKIASSENKIKEICENYKIELDKIFLDMNGLKDENDYKTNELKTTIECLRDKNQELEKENRNMLMKKTDMKNKIEELENQIEENKKSMNEVQKKFENILTTALLKAESEKDQLEKEYNERLAVLEHQFYGTLQKMEEDNQNKILDMVRENKELEEELNNLSRQASNSMKINDPSTLSNKIHDLLKIQDNLKKELEETRLEKDRQIAELISKFEREKEHYNINILEYEVKLKAFENKNLTNFDLRKSNELFELEKEKLKWKNEKERLLNTIENLNSQISKIKRRSDNLVKDKENNKLSCLNSNGNFISSSQNNPNSNNYHNINNFRESNGFNYDHGDDKALNKASLLMRNNSSLNDKEILLLENAKKNNLNLNTHNVVSSPMKDFKFSFPNFNIKSIYSSNENNVTKENLVYTDMVAPHLSQAKLNRKDSSVNKLNNNCRISPFKNKK